MINRFLIVILSLIPTLLSAQTGNSIFRQIEIRTGDHTFSSPHSMVVSEGEKSLYFYYQHEDEIAEIALFPVGQYMDAKIKLVSSGDYEIVDSMNFYDQAWRCKIKFHSLTQSQFLKLQIQYGFQEDKGIEVIRLFPCTRTSLSFKPVNDELFIGEEKVFELITNHADNLRFSGDWTSGLGIDYRIEKQNNQVFLHLVPNQQGLQKLHIEFRTQKPYMDSITNQPVFRLEPLEYAFNVKTSRLRYLNIDRKDITLDETSRTLGVEIQLDNSKPLEINRTYRVENQENPGGVLIAEIYTRSYLSDNKVLCFLRTYNYHKSTEGYLYIKEGDEARFISNFNITPATSISKLSVMRDGSDWIPDLSVYPGETISVKIEGTALYKAQFHFEELLDITADTLIQNEKEVILKLIIPADISKKRISLYNNSVNTGLALSVKEYEIPRPFDYITVNYGDINRVVSGIHGPVLFDKTIRDIVISFNSNRIDSDDKLYGRQHLTIDVRVTGPANELIDMKTLPNITVCPSDNSPRYKYYDKRNCSQGEISLNKYLRRNTSDLDDWSRIQLTFKNTTGRYEGESLEKEMEIILKKKYKFDIDVSFPAGLVTVSKDSETGKTSFSNLYGISMAMVAQFAFYHPEKIAKIRPYRFGAGFLALDAFNFQSERQDLALVALASLYPTTRDKKLAFPLYIGGGYQFKAEKWMLLIGPGISVKL